MADQLYDPAAETAAPPPGVLVAGHFQERPGYHVHRSSGTKDWLITYTVGGTGVFRQSALRLVVRPGDMTLLTPGAVHDYAASGGVWEFSWAHFLPRPTWTAWLQWPAVGRGLHRLHIPAGPARERIARAFSRLVQDARATGPLREELALNALEEVLILVARERERTAGAGVDPRVQQVLDRIAANPAARYTVAELARSVSLSPSRLAHLFKAQVGDSLIETIVKLRLRQASRLLEYTRRQVKEIARDVGFDSPFYFSRRFHAHFGMSPTEYRRRLGR
ncbi:MAG TPA: helix-turn-helix domain-containing protein [Limnochordia bacterium]